MDPGDVEVLAIYSGHSKALASMFAQQGLFLSALFFLIFRSTRIHVVVISKQLDLILVICTLVFNGLMSFAGMAHATEALLLYGKRRASVGETRASLWMEWAAHYLKISCQGFTSTAAIGLVLENYMNWPDGLGAGVGVAISAGSQLLGVLAILLCAA